MLFNINVFNVKKHRFISKINIRKTFKHYELRKSLQMYMTVYAINFIIKVQKKKQEASFLLS